MEEVTAVVFFATGVGGAFVVEEVSDQNPVTTGAGGGTRCGGGGTGAGFETVSGSPATTGWPLEAAFAFFGWGIVAGIGVR